MSLHIFETNWTGCSRWLWGTHATAEEARGGKQRPRALYIEHNSFFNLNFTFQLLTWPDLPR